MPQIDRQAHQSAIGFLGLDDGLLGVRCDLLLDFGLLLRDGGIVSRCGCYDRLLGGRLGSRRKTVFNYLLTAPHKQVKYAALLIGDRQAGREVRSHEIDKVFLEGILEDVREIAALEQRLEYFAERALPLAHHAFVFALTLFKDAFLLFGFLLADALLRVGQILGDLLLFEREILFQLQDLLVV